MFIGINSLVGLIAANEEAQRFYRNIPDLLLEMKEYGLISNSDDKN